MRLVLARQQALQGVGGEQGGVARQHHHRAGGLVAECLQRQADRVAGAMLLRLHDRHRGRVDLLEVRDHLLAAVADDDERGARAERLGGDQDMTEQASPADRVQDLGEL